MSVIIVNHNAGDYLCRAVESLDDGRVRDIVVVDNASRDASLDRLRERHGTDGRLRLLRLERNVGFAATCNRGLALAEGELLLFLNPDCRLYPGALDAMCRVVERDLRTAMAGPRLVNPDGSEQRGGRRDIPNPWQIFCMTLLFHRLMPNHPRFRGINQHGQPLPDGPVEVQAISGACMLVRRFAIQDVGQWDEGYFLHCEDLDFSMSLRRKGWKILFVPDARIVHDKGGCSHCRPIFVEWHKHLGMIRFYRKFFRAQYPGVLMWLVVAGVWLRFLGIAAYHTGHLLELKMGLVRE